MTLYDNLPEENETITFNNFKIVSVVGGYKKAQEIVGLNGWEPIGRTGYKTYGHALIAIKRYLTGPDKYGYPDTQVFAIYKDKERWYILTSR